MNVILVGAGGHARVVADCIRAGGGTVAAYVDRRVAAWLDAARYDSDEAVPADGQPVAMGLGGVRPEVLARRLALLEAYLQRGFDAPALRHPRSWTGEDVSMAEGAMVLAGALIQPGVVLARGVIVNTGAIVEHETHIGTGTHVAPGAVVLGECRIGANCLIGAGAVLLPGTGIEDGTLVSAATRYPR